MIFTRFSIAFYIVGAIECFAAEWFVATKYLLWLGAASTSIGQRGYPWASLLWTVACFAWLFYKVMRRRKEMRQVAMARWLRIEQKKRFFSATCRPNSIGPDAKTEEYVAGFLHSALGTALSGVVLVALFPITLTYSVIFFLTTSKKLLCNPRQA